MKTINGLNRGMGIGGWLTNYKRFNVLPKDRRMLITVGDMEHFESYITESDVAYIASLGMDHIRLGFDQIVLEESPFVYRKEIVKILHDFVDWCRKYNLRAVLNMHKAIGNYCDILEESGLMQSEPLQDRFVALWSMLENEFADQNDVIFELLNEVVSATADEWNALAGRTVDAIRAKNTDRIIIVGGTDWNNPSGLRNVKIYDDENIVYTFHFSLIVGDLTSIRETALALDAKVDHRKFEFSEDRQNFSYINTTDKGFGNQDCLDFDFDRDVWLRSSFIYVSAGECKKILLDAAFEGGEIEGVAHFRTYGETTTPDRKGTPCSGADVPFKLIGDGERRMYEIDISAIDKPFFQTSLIFRTKGHAKIYALELK